jgi:hypothetical protein
MSGYQALNANYGGRQPNETAYIKNFNDGSDPSLWTLQKYNYNGATKIVLLPVSARANNVYVPGDLFVDGSIVNPSDINLKENIVEISSELTDSLINLKPVQYTYKTDKAEDKKNHYGFIAQELEIVLPELVVTKPDISNSDKIKAINYLEIIPLLVGKLQKMQTEIDNLKLQIQTISKNE